MTYLVDLNNALVAYLHSRGEKDAVVAELDEVSVYDNGGCSCSSSYYVTLYIKYKRAWDQKNWNFFEVHEDPIEFLRDELPEYAEK